MYMSINAYIGSQLGISKFRSVKKGNADTIYLT